MLPHICVSQQHNHLPPGALPLTLKFSVLQRALAMWGDKAQPEAVLLHVSGGKAYSSANKPEHVP